GFAGAEAPHLARILGACGTAADRPLLLGLLRGDAPAIRAAAADALGALGGGDQETEEALCFALADEAVEVRAAAARALGRFASPPAASALAGAATDGDPGVRVAAV